MIRNLRLTLLLSATVFTACKEDIVQVSVPSDSSLNYAAVFDGETSFVEIFADSSQQPQELTVELKVWLDTTHAGSFPFISESNLDQWNQADGFSVKFEENQIHWKLATQPNLANAFRPTIVLQSKRWYHIACTYDGTVGRIYVDTTLLYEDNRAFTIYYGPNGFRFGHSYNSFLGGDVFFKGQMDEIRLWAVARTKNQILSSMNSPLQGNESGLVGYWSFDATSNRFDPAQDHSSNQNHGHLNGRFTLVQSTAFN